MPDLTITLTAANIARIRAAFGSGTTQADIEAWIKETLKLKVRDAESTASHNATFNAVTNEVW